MGEMMSSNNVTRDTVMAETQQMYGLISDEDAATIELVVDIYLNNFLSYIGLIGNIMQIIVFCKLGFKETINISLTFLAAWDLVRCIANVLTRVQAIVKLLSPAMAISWKAITSAYLAYNSGIAGYVSSVLASYVAIERCLCVSLPFTVHYILTPKVVFFTNTIISVIVFASLSMSNFFCKVYQVFYPPLNATIYSWRFNSLWTPEMESYLSAMYILWVLLSFVAICVSTIIISYHLKKMSRFIDNRGRLSSAAAKDRPSAQKSLRDRQIIKMNKMLLVIIGVYIVNSLPRMLFFIVRMFVPEFDHQQRYHNLLWLSVNIMNIFDFINAAINPFILFFMSSNFKAMFLETFLCHAASPHSAEF